MVCMLNLDLALFLAAMAKNTGIFPVKTAFLCMDNGLPARGASASLCHHLAPIEMTVAVQPQFPRTFVERMTPRQSFAVNSQSQMLEALPDGETVTYVKMEAGGSSRQSAWCKCYLPKPW